MEVALSQLDTLTKEENLIAARISEVTYNNNVRAIEDGTCHSLVIFQACPDPLPAISETASEEFIRLLPIAAIFDPKADTDAGSQLQEKLRTWLSPPDPSINHRTARNIQHRGSATWFFQSDTFHEWKKNGSLLWIRGDRTFLPPF